MQYDKEVDIYVKGLVQAEDFGGYVEQPTLHSTISAFLTPATDELTIQDNVIVKVTQIKLFSNDDIPADVTMVKCEGVEYEVTSYTNFGKILMLKLSEL